MSFENIDIDSLTDARRKSIEETVQQVTGEQMKTIGEGIFPYADDPWRERFFEFLTENPGCTFYHATTNDRVEILYCREKERGIWFLPGSGLGPLQSKGLKIMKDAVARA